MAMQIRDELVVDEPFCIGRIKSFSQKSGWGFIQLFENGVEDSEGSKDVFFHRADVAKSGTCELRQGILVHCNVVSTGKGEKASNIRLIDETGVDVAANAPEVSVTCLTCLGSSEDSLSHSPYGSEMTTMPSAPSPSPATRAASYSLRTSENYITWACSQCEALNASRSICRVMVVCASCGLAHRVQSWICVCSHINKYGSRHCAACDMPHAMSCQELHVLPVHAVDGAAEMDVKEHQALNTGRKMHRLRSRWQHGNAGWFHPSVGASDASSWCQDTTAHPLCSKQPDLDLRREAIVEKCRTRLLWAVEWLLKGKSGALKERALSNEWLHRFSQEVAKPEHRLFCAAQGHLALVPNPCSSIEDPDVLLMYEAIGMLLALAVTEQQALHLLFPMWMARSLLGYPTTVQDLDEFDPQLRQKAEIGIPSTEEITRYGVTKTFEISDAVANNEHPYKLWLKDVYLSKSIEAQLKQIKHGFFYALMGDHLMQELTPTDFYNLLNGGQMQAPRVFPVPLM